MNEPSQVLVIVPKPPFWKRSVRFLAVRVMIYYALICVVVMCIQRHLIYHPERHIAHHFLRVAVVGRMPARFYV